MEALWEVWKENMLYETEEKKKKPDAATSNSFAVLSQPVPARRRRRKPLFRAWVLNNALALVCEVEKKFVTSDVTCFFDPTAAAVELPNPFVAVKTLWKREPTWRTVEEAEADHYATMWGYYKEDYEDDDDIVVCDPEHRALLPRARASNAIIVKMLGEHAKNVPKEFTRALLDYGALVTTEGFYAVELLGEHGRELQWRPIAVPSYEHYCRLLRKDYVGDQDRALENAHISSIGKLWETPSWLSVAAHGLINGHRYLFAHQIPNGMKEFFCDRHYATDNGGGGGSMRSCGEEVQALSKCLQSARGDVKRILTLYGEIIYSLYSEADCDMEEFARKLGDFEKTAIRSHLSDIEEELKAALAATAATEEAAAAAPLPPIGVAASSARRSSYDKDFPPL